MDADKFFAWFVRLAMLLLLIYIAGVTSCIGVTTSATYGKLENVGPRR